MIAVSTNPVGPAQGQSGRQEIAARGGNALPDPVVRASGADTGPAMPLPGSNAADAAAALAADRQRLQKHFDAFIAQHDQEAHFVYDKSTGLTIVQIVNRTSGELVRQIPTEEVVRIAQYLDARNAFLDVKA
jgi:flagellar protein FlaG